MLLAGLGSQLGNVYAVLKDQQLLPFEHVAFRIVAQFVDVLVYISIAIRGLI